VVVIHYGSSLTPSQPPPPAGEARPPHGECYSLPEFGGEGVQRAPKVNYLKAGRFDCTSSTILTTCAKGWSASLTLRPKGGMPMRVTVRESAAEQAIHSL